MEEEAEDPLFSPTTVAKEETEEEEEVEEGMMEENHQPPPNEGLTTATSNQMSMVLKRLARMERENKQKAKRVKLLESQVAELFGQLSEVKQELDRCKRIPTRLDVLSELPTELALMVLSFLPPTTVALASLVCKHWRALSNENFLWRQLCRRYFGLKGRTNKAEHHHHLPHGARKSTKVNWKDNFRKQTITGRRMMAGQPVKERSLDHMYEQQPHDKPSKNVYCLDVNRHCVVSGGNNNLLRVWSLATGECMATLTGHHDFVWCLCLQENIVCSGSRDATIKVWDVESAQCIKTLQPKGGERWIRCLKFSGNILASGAEDCKVNIWDLRTGQAEITLAGHEGLISCLQLNDELLVSGSSRDGSLRFWDIRAVTSSSSFSSRKTEDESLNWHNNKNKKKGGEEVMEEPEDVMVVEGAASTKTSRCLRRVVLKHGAPNCLQFDERVLLSGNSDRSILACDVTTGRLLARKMFCHERYVWTLQFDQLKMVSGGYDGMVKVWRMPSSASWSPSSSFHSSSSPHSSASSWALEEMASLKSTKQWISAVRFDDARIVHGNGNDVVIHEFDDFTSSSISATSTITASNSSPEEEDDSSVVVEVFH
ncbi:Lissencephaly-1 [Balamuthia mandrillaris]